MQPDGNLLVQVIETRPERQGFYRGMNAVISPQGEWVIPPFVYMHIYRLDNWYFYGALPVRDEGFLRSHYLAYPEGEEYAYGTNQLKVIDGQGSVVIDFLGDVLDTDGRLLSVRRGFFVGLIDTRGLWIYRESIFNTLMD